MNDTYWNYPLPFYGFLILMEYTSAKTNDMDAFAAMYAYSNRKYSNSTMAARLLFIRCGGNSSVT